MYDETIKTSGMPPFLDGELPHRIPGDREDFGPAFRPLHPLRELATFTTATVILFIGARALHNQYQELRGRYEEIRHDS